MRSLLILVALIACLPAADTPLADADMLAMAKRRLVNGDVGYTAEHWQLARRNIERDNKSWEPRILARGKPTADGRIPIRFKVLIGTSQHLSEQQIPAIIIDAWFSRDDFGTWKMEWKYNTDQTLVVQEGLSTQLAQAGKVQFDPEFIQALPRLLKSGIFPAQVQFQGGAYRDSDKNGIGEFASDLEVMSGVRKTDAGIELALLPNTLVADLQRNAVQYTLLADGHMGFWFFAVNPFNRKTLVMTHGGALLEADEVLLPKSLAEAKAAVGKAKPANSH